MKRASGIQSASAYRLAFDYRFEAAHRFTRSLSEPCMTPHGHTWRAKAVFAAADSSLDEGEMVMEFAKLKGAWKSFIQETVDHSFMHHFNDPILPALKEHVPGFRGLPFPGDPTTEMIAALFFAKLSAMHAEVRGGGLVRPVGVVIRETPTNSIAFRADSERGTELLKRIDREFAGWWQSADPKTRDLKEA